MLGCSLLATSDGDTPGVLGTTQYIGDLPERVANRNQTRTSYSYNGTSGVANAPGDFGWAQVSRVLTFHSISNTVTGDNHPGVYTSNNTLPRSEWIGARSFFTCDSVILTRNGSNYWPHGDADGSPLALTLENGTVAERYDYADFGEPAFFNGSGTSIAESAVGNSHLFKGLPYESETGLYWMGTESADSPQGGTWVDPRTGGSLQPSVGRSTRTSPSFWRGQTDHST